MDGYASPKHKLLKVFKEGRDKWKIKAMEAKKNLKLKHNRMVFLETSKEKVQMENKSLKQQITELNAEVSRLKLSLANAELKKKVML